MNQAAPLHGCRLLGAFADEHDSLQRALAMQARALGIAVESVSDAGREQFYCLQGQGLAPTHCRLTGWDDEAPRAISEFTLQAACGLMAVHGRASGQAQAIDLDYLAHVVASLALTGLMATALARLRGGQVTDCSVSLPGAGLQCISQYLAGATAERGAERLPAGCSSARLRPPFVSADGVVFELETLDAGPWLAFWDGLGVPGPTAAKVGRASCCAMPAPLHRCQRLCVGRWRTCRTRRSSSTARRWEWPSRQSINPASAIP